MSKPYSPNAVIIRGNRLWWRPTAYCEGCGKRIGPTSMTLWNTIRIKVPEFRGNAICPGCLEKQRLGLIPPSYPWWYPNRPGWVLPAWKKKQ